MTTPWQSSLAGGDRTQLIGQLIATFLWQRDACLAQIDHVIALYSVAAFLPSEHDFPLDDAARSVDDA
jgi:hypothetical protein